MNARVTMMHGTAVRRSNGSYLVVRCVSARRDGAARRGRNSLQIDSRFFTCSRSSTISTISISNSKIFRRGRRFRGELFDGPGERRGLELWVEVTVEIGRVDFERLAEGVFAFAQPVHEQVLKMLRMTRLSRHCAPLLAPFTAAQTSAG